MSEESESKQELSQEELYIRRKPNGEEERVPWEALSPEERSHILRELYKVFEPFYDIFKDFRESQEFKDS